MSEATSVPRPVAGEKVARTLLYLGWGVWAYLSVGFNLVSTLAVRWGLAGATGLHVDVLVWIVRAAAAVFIGAVAVLAWRLSRWLGGWTGWKVWLGAACMVLLAGMWTFMTLGCPGGRFLQQDSDDRLVPTWAINECLGPEIRLPAGARDLHFLNTGGMVDGKLFLRFTADPAESRRFVDAVRSANGLGDDASKNLDYGEPILRWRGKAWWTPSPDRPWWSSRNAEGLHFVELDEATGTVHLAFRK